MALPFEGNKTFAQPADFLWEKLHDARFLGKCIPDVEAVTETTKTSFACRLRPGFSFVRGTLDLTLQVSDASPMQPIRLELRTRGIGTSSAVQAVLEVRAIESGSNVHWLVDVELGGLLKAVPGGLLRAAAQKVLSDAWEKAAVQITSES